MSRKTCVLPLPAMCTFLRFPIHRATVLVAPSGRKKPVVERLVQHAVLPGQTLPSIENMDNNKYGTSIDKKPVGERLDAPLDDSRAVFPGQVPRSIGSEKVARRSR